MRPRLAWQALGQELCILKTNTDLDTADLGSGEWMSWDQLADEETFGEAKALEALNPGGTAVYIVGSGAEAKEKLFGIMREGATVIEASSATMEQIGVTSELASSKKYSSVRNTVRSIDDPKKKGRGEEKRHPLGVLHRERASDNGRGADGGRVGNWQPDSALRLRGGQKIILVAGTQKIVRNLDDAFKRIKEHAVPEHERLQKTLGIGSSINKILIIEKEREGKRTMILVKEKLGF